eukprot:6652494-Prymnesium_polylepis.1
MYDEPAENRPPPRRAREGTRLSRCGGDEGGVAVTKGTHSIAHAFGTTNGRTRTAASTRARQHAHTHGSTRTRTEACARQHARAHGSAHCSAALARQRARGDTHPEAH